MKKTKTTLLILTLLCQGPAFSIDREEMVKTPITKAKSTKKQKKLPQPRTVENPSGWYSTDQRIKVKYREVQEIGAFQGNRLYGYIDPSLSHRQWEIALGKDLAKTGQGNNGVKILKKNNKVTLLELKMNGDERLYATDVHTNELGEYLAIFNRQGRHKEISRMANNNKFSVKSDCFSKVATRFDQIITCK